MVSMYNSLAPNIGDHSYFCYQRWLFFNFEVHKQNQDVIKQITMLSPHSLEYGEQAFFWYQKAGLFIK